MDDLSLRLQKRNPFMQALINGGKGLLSGKVEDGQGTDEIDRMIKYNQYMTGTPDFEMKKAQTMADMRLQEDLQAEAMKKKMAQDDYSAALSKENQGPNTVLPSQSISPQPAIANGQGQAAYSAAKPNSVPQFLTINDPATREYDSKMGRFVEKPGNVHLEKNQDYVTPEDQKANAEKEQMIKDSASQNLESIKEIKKGSRFFGPMGDIPSQYAPSSLPVIGGLTMGEPKLKGEYADRAAWESNINQLLSRKVVDLITQMKSASKTGATGFGQLSDKEGAILQQASTALNKRLPAEVAMKYLGEIEKINQRILSGGQANSNIPTFSSEAEAEASGYKGDAIIAGREATIN